VHSVPFAGPSRSLPAPPPPPVPCPLAHHTSASPWRKARRESDVMEKREKNEEQKMRRGRGKKWEQTRGRWEGGNGGEVKRGGASTHMFFHTLLYLSTQTHTHTPPPHTHTHTHTSSSCASFSSRLNCRSPMVWSRSSNKASCSLVKLILS